MFALIPLHEIAPQLVHPILQKNIKALIEACDDKLAVTKFRKLIRIVIIHRIINYYFTAVFNFKEQKSR
jgi:hypothetical protein